MIKSVAIVEDDLVLREQLIRILRSAPDVNFVGAFASAEEALKDIPVRKPDVVLMDIRLPGMSGIQCVAKLKKLDWTIQVIMVTVYEDSGSIFNALKAGASGYIVKSKSADQLLNAVRDVGVGGAPMSSHIARRVVEHFHTSGPAHREKENLSPREEEVLTLLASGFLYKEIAERLGIATETVRTHVKHICDKLHVRNRLEAVAKRHDRK